MSRLVYLASPYTHPDPWVRQERYEQALAAQTRLLDRGEFVFSPIVQTHYSDMKLRQSKDHAFWMRLALEYLHRCDALLILTLEGWQWSKGVKAEMDAAKLAGLPVEFMEWPEPLREGMGG